VESANTYIDARSMTLEGYHRLRSELAVLRTERRQDGLQEQDQLEGRIAQLAEALAAARIVLPVDDGTAGIGTRVSVRRQDGGVADYELVPASEADVPRGRISVASPVAQALAGRSRGDVVEVETPRGRMQLEILAVEHLPAAVTPL
jgi:transcription elongation GreA/GreB family factor